MRHRSPRPFLDLWRRAPTPRLRWLLVSAALAVFGVATGLSLAAQHRTGGEGTTDAAAPPSATSAPSTSRTATPSRSSDRSAPSRSRTAAPGPSAPVTPATPGPSIGLSTVLPSPTVPTSPLPPPPPTPTRSTTPVDTVPPSTTASTVSTNDRTWRLALGADEPATFWCDLDGAGYRACSPSPAFRVAPGHHTVLVRAVDRAGNVDRTPTELSAHVNAAPS